MNSPHAVFMSTRWSLIGMMTSGDPQRAADAEQRLTETYWPAVYAYLRRSGLNPDAAEELTQAFFVDVVCARQLFARASPQRGRLRSLILSALRNHARDLDRRQNGRGDSRRHWTACLDADFASEEAILARSDAPPELMFERRWAMAQLSEALRRCESHFTECGKHAHWALFENRVVRPAISAQQALPLSHLADANGFESPADAAAAVQTVKRRFEALLREVVAESLDEDDDVEAETADVVALIRGK